MRRKQSKYGKPFVVFAAAGVLGVAVSCSNGASAVKNAAVAGNVMGTWEGKCHDSDLLDLSMQEFLMFEGADTQLVQRFYSEDDCREPAVIVRYKGSFVVREDVAETPGGKQVDFEYNTVTVTALNEAGRKTLDNTDFCGHEEWMVNTEVDLTVNSTRDLCLLYDTPHAKYDIFLVNGDELKMGLKEGERDKSTPGLRPIHVGGEVYLKSEVEL
ncbi:MAG: hypothetical protein AB7P04_14310 [Bacteriovoracia bacterium]